ncbi:hypothetical protein SAMN05216176_113137 [Nitratireductor indicus]|nr:hypothetical protein SAMN05216176_113137 [Nitratireductor indicus]
MKKLPVLFSAALTIVATSFPAHASLYLCSLLSQKGIVRISANSQAGAQLQTYQVAIAMGHPAGSATMRRIRCISLARSIPRMG